MTIRPLMWLLLLMVLVIPLPKVHSHDVKEMIKEIEQDKKEIPEEAADSPSALPSRELTVASSPEVLRNQLRFQYGTVFKYNGRLLHSQSRIWVTTKVHAPKLERLSRPYNPWEDVCKTITNDMINNMCRLTIPANRQIRWRMEAYQRELMSLKDQLYRAYPALNPEFNITIRRQRRAILPLLGFVGKMVAAKLIPMAIEKVPSWIRAMRRRKQAKALRLLEQQQASFNHLRVHKEDLMLFGEYTLESLEGMIKSIENIHQDGLRTWGYFQEYSKCIKENPRDHDTCRRRFSALTNGEHSARFLFLLALIQRENTYASTYVDLLPKVREFVHSLATLSRGYLSPVVFPPTVLGEMIASTRAQLADQLPDYRITMDDVMAYYDMKLATVSIDPTDHTLVITFPIFVQQYTLEPLNLYEIETTYVPIDDKNYTADSYTRVDIAKPYIATGNQHYIQLTIPELRMCKMINYLYLCEELFIIKHRSKHSCATSLFYQYSSEQVAQACNFHYYFNTTPTPTVLDGGNQIVLANMISQKKLTCNKFQELATPFASQRYLMINRSVLCGCQIEADYAYLYELPAHCNAQKEQPTAMWFTINLGFQEHIRDLDSRIANLTSEVTQSMQEFDIALRDLPPRAIHTNDSDIHVKRPDNLKRLIERMRIEQQYPQALTDYSRRRTKSKGRKLVQFLAIKLLIAGVVLALVGVLYAILANKIKLGRIQASLAGLPAAIGLTDAVGPYTVEGLEQNEEVENTCTRSGMEWYTTVLFVMGCCGCANFVWKRRHVLNPFRGRIYRDPCTVCAIIGDGRKFIPIKIRTAAGSPYSYWINRPTSIDQIRHTRGFFFDTIDFYWDDVELKYDDIIIPLPTRTTVALDKKFALRSILQSDLAHFMIMVKQEKEWMVVQGDRRLEAYRHTQARDLPELPENVCRRRRLISSRLSKRKGWSEGPPRTLTRAETRALNQWDNTGDTDVTDSDEEPNVQEFKGPYHEELYQNLPPPILKSAHRSALEKPKAARKLFTPGQDEPQTKTIPLEPGSPYFVRLPVPTPTGAEPQTPGPTPLEVRFKPREEEPEAAHV